MRLSGMSYAAKLHLESELCYEWAILNGMDKVAFAISPISNRQLNTAILEACVPTIMDWPMKVILPDTKLGPVNFKRYERIGQ